VGKTNSDKPGDTDVLRAKDIIPPYKKDIIQKPKQPLKEETSHRIEDKAIHKETPPVEPKNATQQKAEIPKFDLAEHILSEQRKTATVRRKGPGTINQTINNKREIRSTGYNIQSQPKLSQQEQIIAEIVARDIQKLCNGHIQEFSQHQM